MKEERYAILIGMNNYEDAPLEYSVKDVHDVKNVLVTNCRFKENNIKCIIDKRRPVIDQINEAFDEIKSTFVANRDLFLFYYSGHGEYDDSTEKSLLEFEDESQLFLSEIAANYFRPLRAKSEYLIVDACYSGKSLYIKSKSNRRKRERKLLNDSKELYFLFAAESDKKAYQEDSLQNSYYTYYLVEAIRSTHLYGEGILSMTTIDDYVRRKLSTHPSVVQIPGSESRITGYKPFAFLNEEDDALPIVRSVEQHSPAASNTINALTVNNTQNKKLPMSDFQLETSLTSDNRNQIFEALKQVLKEEVDQAEYPQLSVGYTIEKLAFEQISIPSDIQRELDKHIIQAAKKQQLLAIDDIFEVQVSQPRRSGLNTMFDIINGPPEPITTYTVWYNDHTISTVFIRVTAQDIFHVSGGLFIFVYQAKYGFVFGKAVFRYDWAGVDEKISKFVDVSLTPYRLVSDNVGLVRAQVSDALLELAKRVNNWNVDRMKEIEGFLNMAK